VADSSASITELRQELARAERDLIETRRLREDVRSSVASWVAQLREMLDSSPPDARARLMMSLHDAIAVQELSTTQTENMVEDTEQVIASLRSEIDELAGR
jgi:hypothetical protein